MSWIVELGSHYIQIHDDHFHIELTIHYYITYPDRKVFLNITRINHVILWTGLTGNIKIYH
jgi:hypothetical protein